MSFIFTISGRLKAVDVDKQTVSLYAWPADVAVVELKLRHPLPFSLQTLYNMLPNIVLKGDIRQGKYVAHTLEVH